MRATMAQSGDILIVGGGVIGTSIAWALARRRPGRVVLLEKAYLGAGSSGKSGAIIRQHYSNRLTAAMAQKSLRFFERFDEIVGGPPVFTRTGMLLLVNAKDRDGLEANLALQQELGIRTGIISRQELGEIDRNARLAEDEIVAFESEAGYVEAVQAVCSFADAARRNGADVREGVEVKAVIIEKGRFVGIQTSEGRYESRTLVLATGPWAKALARDLKLDLPVEACR